MLRPRPARWFEILAARDDATLVLEALARTGAVELEARPGTAMPDSLAELMPLLVQYQDRQARYQAYWPATAQCQPSACPERPQAALQRSLDTIRAWAQQAEPVIRDLQHAQAEQQELQLWQQALPALHPRAIDTAQLAAAGPWLGVRLCVLPSGVDPLAVLPAQADLLATPVPIGDDLQFLVTATPEALQSLAQAVTALKGSLHKVPAWLQADAEANTREAAARSAALLTRIAAAQATLLALHRQHALPRALGDAHRLHWLAKNVHALEAGERLCWITGWSSDARGEHLTRALHDCGARALLHFAPAPHKAPAPLLLDNPAWARPFELFSRALGMPAATEPDPSPVLAVAVPLMFGYMFGDVGQGLLIAAIGYWARERSPVARLLMVGGLSAAVFGLLFGSVFGLHGLLPALWLHPLDAPLAVLMAPLAGGVVLLTLGLLLDALAAGWRGEWRRWWLTDAALLPLYLGLMAAFVAPGGLYVAAAALLWFCIGHAWQQQRPTAGFAALGEALEKSLQILINTLSFARVGAFALAHAGLSSAIVALMDAADSSLAKAVVLVLGNALVIVLEAMVVSIQTTRLVLFEFFTRFMQGTGRAFRPLPAPPYPSPATPATPEN